MRVHVVHPGGRGFPAAPVLFACVIALALVEIALIVLLVTLIGWLPTALITLVTAMIGLTMIRVAGVSVWRRFQAELASGRFPHEAIAEGVLILVGGAFLIIPGPLTDLLGMTTLIPAVRRMYARAIVRRMGGSIVPMPFGQPQAGGHSMSPPPGGDPPGPSSGPTVFDVPSDVEDARGGPANREEAVDVEFRRTE